MNTDCISNSQKSRTLDMQIFAKAHQHKEECFLKNILARIQTNNMSCTPKILKSYPQYVVNHTSWCQDKEIYEIIGTFIKIIALLLVQVLNINIQWSLFMV